MTAAGPRAQRLKAQRAERKRYRPHGAALGLLVVALIVSSMYPAQQLVAKRHRLAALKSQSAALDRQITELRARRDALQTDQEVERIARRDLRMIRPGEHAFAVLPGRGAPAPAPAAAGPAPDETAPEGALSRWWSAVSRAFRIPR